MSTAKREAVDVMGYLARNWLEQNKDNPALILNPKATPLDMLAWAWGEITSLEATLLALTAGQHEITTGDLSAIIQHRLCPLSNVMDFAIHALLDPANAERQEG
ncbi:MAG: hypothetical protein Q8R06_09710 [Polaromonas sp.]|uniref:hypothetical protein n=1 Tax=Polaromonas sp. TaxID=1869339 RepID=UPI002734020F|nr:hypothetical protein [Polaromonas sp.]MDP3797411.1 hypothetical protein [Polaromonas sp.]